MDQPRRLAVSLLIRSEENGYANLLLKAALDKSNLDNRDKQFVSALVYGTLEKQYTIDALLNCFLKKPVGKLDAAVRAIMRSGLYQCRYMDSVPDYAAINASVELTRKFGKSSACGMVNAVLRKATFKDVKQLAFADKTEELSTLFNVSSSIVKMLTCSYPEQVIDILENFTVAAPVCIRVNTLRIQPKELCNLLAVQGVTATEFENPAVLQITDGDFLHSDAFRDGLFHVQGLSSGAAADAVCVAPGEKILDLCAAPGGKSLTMAYAMQNRGRLFCRELQQSRVSLISGQLERCGVSCADIGQGDAAVYEPALDGADAVLCDVPCSGSGTLSKKPDIRFKDIEVNKKALTDIQYAILENASRYPKIRGRLVYSTCSLDPAENGDVVRRFLVNHPEYRLVPLLLPGFRTVEDGLMYTILPQNGKNDGFFIAKLMKV